jgi:DNA-binding response OmpR family regulator
VRALAKTESPQLVPSFSKTAERTSRRPAIRFHRISPQEILKLSQHSSVVIVMPHSDSAISFASAGAQPEMLEQPLLELLDEATVTLEARNRAEEFSFGRVRLNFTEMSAFRGDQPVRLTSLEFKTLRYLIKNARRVISRDELLNQVWGYENYPCTRTVDNHILRLRQKLESDPARPVHLLTVHRAGYKFMP